MFITLQYFQYYKAISLMLCRRKCVADLVLNSLNSYNQAQWTSFPVSVVYKICKEKVGVFNENTWKQRYMSSIYDSVVCGKRKNNLQLWPTFQEVTT